MSREFFLNPFALFICTPRLVLDSLFPRGDSSIILVFFLPSSLIVIDWGLCLFHKQPIRFGTVVAGETRGQPNVPCVSVAPIMRF